MSTTKSITSLADLTKLTKASLSGGLESQEYFYKADEVEALVAHLTPADDDMLRELEEMAETARKAFAAWDADQSSMFFLDVSDTADMELGRVVAEQLPALLARIQTDSREVTALRRYVDVLLIELLAHPELPESIHKSLYAQRQTLVVAKEQADA